ncbi:biotin--[acetyl-CoA-carboxylase] ligase [Candidatus Cytomitobacter primus]|nr:biotin--[acetyl-CoA-carboxylase] ligase [Candidatus Cytomitobacter primus]
MNDINTEITKTDYDNFSILHFQELSSTQAFAKEIIHGDLLHYSNDLLFKLMNENKFLTIISDTQNSGVGQYGRSWVSPHGNLYMSCIVKLDKCDVINLTQVFALLVHDILLNDYGILIQIKWINDILYSSKQINSKKMGGIICEVCKLKDGKDMLQSKDVLIVGIGININVATADNSICMRDILKDTDNMIGQTNIIDKVSMVSKDGMHGKVNSGDQINIVGLAEKICHKLPKYLDQYYVGGIEVFIDKLNSNAAYINENVILYIRESEIKGIFKGYDKNGMIILEYGNGVRESFHEGRMRLADSSDYIL